MLCYGGKEDYKHIEFMKKIIFQVRWHGRHGIHGICVFARVVESELLWVFHERCVAWGEEQTSLCSGLASSGDESQVKSKVFWRNKHHKSHQILLPLLLGGELRDYF